MGEVLQNLEGRHHPGHRSNPQGTTLRHQPMGESGSEWQVDQGSLLRGIALKVTSGWVQSQVLPVVDCYHTRRREGWARGRRGERGRSGRHLNEARDQHFDPNIHLLPIYQDNLEGKKDLRERESESDIPHCSSLPCSCTKLYEVCPYMQPNSLHRLRSSPLYGRRPLCREKGWMDAVQPRVPSRVAKEALCSC